MHLAPCTHPVAQSPLSRGIRRFGPWALGFAVAAALQFAPATSQAQASVAAQVQLSYDHIKSLLAQRQYAQAIEAADRYLGSNPRDPQVRFLKGVAQKESGDTAAAVETFSSVIQAYPELPEPYNNLAAIYAAQGDYEKARDALLQAIQANPAYAAAHENLGDVYIQLARQQYQAAAARETDNDGLRRKLDQAGRLLQQ